uniref:Bromodomain-containing protein 8 n=1 Tax=Hucho hucho TaxID=62062 RepID=A0A4W5LEZ8_9TELE
MASGVGKHKLLAMGPTEPWSVREKLCLATSVMKSGDQNWVSVSRAIKPFAEPGRPPDWFSQKHCASQYSELLETTETPKRKRGEKGEVVETVEDVIVRRLTAERIEELKRLIKDTQEKHRKLKKEAELIQAGHLDSKLEELWGEIVQKKKQEEEEADVKRKAIDTAYLARQAVKNTPKRVPSVTVRSPPGCGSPSLEFCQGDTPQSTPEDPSTSVTVSPCQLQGNGAPEASGMGSLLDDSPQKKLLGQKATPPSSPLLSELLKKGSFIPTSPRLVSYFLRLFNTTVHGVSFHLISSDMSVKPITMIMSSICCLYAEIEYESYYKAVNTTYICVCLYIGRDEVEASQPGPGEGTEEGLVTVPYMGDELDLETVGDIIAIIEDKVLGDENAEALDAAAVEAALSLCEETGHALSGPWEPGPFKPPESNPAAPTRAPQASSHSSSLHGSLEGKREIRGGASACDSQDNCTSGYTHPLGISGLPPSCLSMMLEHSQAIGARLLSPHPSVPVLNVKEEEEGVSDGEERSASETKEGLDGGDEEAYLSEAEGETELEPPASESEDSYSLHTASSSLQLHTTADSIPSSPASSQFSMCSEDQEAMQAQKIWRKAIMLVWRAAANHRYANVFLQPVTDDIAPGYHSIVHRPMDLSTIKKNIETGLIRTTAEFQRDIMLMFQNAVMYNSCDHDVFHMALEMQRDVLEQIQQFLATQLIMQTSESGVSAKSLRGRESTRKQDPSDKDSVPMASPAFLLSLFDGGTRGRRCAIEADLKMKK